MGRWIEGPVTLRFWSRVQRGGVAECWPWIARKSVHGYGAFYFLGRTVPAHRMAYELERGAVPTRQHVHHLCGNKLCVNPDHLELLAPAKHMMISARRETCPKGHAYTSENVYWRKGRLGEPVRVCRICAAARMKRYRARLRERQ